MNLLHKQFLCIVLLLAVTTVWSQSYNIGGDWLTQEWMDARGWEEKGEFYSEAVGQHVGYLVSLPPSYHSDSAHQYPVVYWLHGKDGSAASANPLAARLDSAETTEGFVEFILIALNSPGSWTEPPRPEMVTSEYIAHIDGKYRTIPTREARALEGYSMGGAGTAHIGWNNLDRYGSISVLAGALHHSITELEPVVRQNAEKAKGNTFLRLHVGEKDYADLRAAMETLHALYDELRLEHDWYLITNASHDPGGSFFPSWDKMDVDMFGFWKRAFGSIPAVAIRSGHISWRLASAGADRHAASIPATAHIYTVQGRRIEQAFGKGPAARPGAGGAYVLRALQGQAGTVLYTNGR